MKMLVVLLLLLLGIANVSGDNRKTKASSKWVVGKNSRLTINGNTNINKFACVITDYPKTDTLLISDDVLAKRVLLSGTMKLEVGSFDCNNLMITKQLRKSLKIGEFPYLSIRFLSLKEMPTLKHKTDIEGWIEIEIAGVNKRFEICYQFKMDGGRISLTGSQAIHFSDFKLIPPKPIGRLVKANDLLNVVFYLQMDKVSNK